MPCKIVEWDTPKQERVGLGDSWTYESVDIRCRHIGDGWHPVGPTRRSVTAWWFSETYTVHLLEWCREEGRFITHAHWGAFEFMKGLHGEIPSALLAILPVLRASYSMTAVTPWSFAARLKQHATYLVDDTSSPLKFQVRLPTGSDAWDNSTITGFCPLSGAIVICTRHAETVDSYNGRFVRCAMIHIV